jgi:hypothetical protein
LLRRKQGHGSRTHAAVAARHGVNLATLWRLGYTPGRQLRTARRESHRLPHRRSDARAQAPCRPGN